MGLGPPQITSVNFIGEVNNITSPINKMKNTDKRFFMTIFLVIAVLSGSILTWLKFFGFLFLFLVCVYFIYYALVGKEKKEIGDEPPSKIRRMQTFRQRERSFEDLEGEIVAKLGGGGSSNFQFLLLTGLHDSQPIPPYLNQAIMKKIHWEYLNLYNKLENKYDVISLSLERILRPLTTEEKADFIRFCIANSSGIQL